MQKGPEYFMEASYLVSRKLPNVRFVMAGSGDMLPKMVERMAELRLLDRFHFTGFVNEDRRNRLLAMADVFVMTSVLEPFGITPVEAIQHDVPVIVTKQCGVSEILRSAIKVRLLGRPQDRRRHHQDPDRGWPVAGDRRGRPRGAGCDHLGQGAAEVQRIYMEMT